MTDHCAEEACTCSAPLADEVRRLNRRALGLSVATVSYNVLEGIASLIAGGIADSVALIGFGLDSFTESLSGGIMIWRFGRHRNAEETVRAEQRAIRLVGITFFVLAAYVLFESVRKFVSAAQPEPSLFGIIIAITSLISMPILYFAKRHTAKKLGSRSLALMVESRVKKLPKARKEALIRNPANLDEIIALVGSP